MHVFLKHTNLGKLKPILSYPIIYSDKMIPYQLSVITLESFLTDKSERMPLL